MAFGISAGTYLMAGAVVGGGLLAANGVKKASETAAQGQDRATDTQRQMYDQTRDDQAPYREAGYTALNQLGTGTTPGGEFNRDFTMADYQADPGYQFRLAEGEKAIQRAAIARGGMYSGATLKALAGYNSDQASQEYSNAYNRYVNNTTTRYNRLASIAGLGQTSLGQTGAAGSSTAAGMASTIAGAGQARASGYVGAGNAVNGTIGNLYNNYNQSMMLKQMMSPSGSTANSYDPMVDTTTAGVNNTMF